MRLSSLFAVLAGVSSLTLSVRATPLAHLKRDDLDSGTPPVYTTSGNYSLIPSAVYHTSDLTLCKGYSASDVQTTDSGLTATLTLIGEPCHAFGARDYDKLKLMVNMDTEDRLHVLIEDADKEAKAIPEEYLPYPKESSISNDQSQLAFSYSNDPSFSFRVTRKDSGEVLFDTSSAGPIVFEDQYVRIGTSLPADANIYGLGEHNDPLRLPTTNYSRTLWNRDAGGLPEYTPLYGHHPIYHDHRLTTSHGPQTHGVFLRSAHGMKIDLNDEKLVFNTLGGVIDLYIFAGPTPKSITQQYHKVVGMPANVPYWSLGLHNCRYGYRDAFELAAVVQNYSDAKIPLETMWVDIDVYDHRVAFTTNPQLFPKERLRSVLDWIHGRQQRFVMMQDPAIAARDNPTYRRGVEAGAFIKNWNGDGTPYEGVVWPGRTVFPDWFAQNTTQWWTDEIVRFFGSDKDNYTLTPVEGEGIQPTLPIDGIWLDMNEAANFLAYVDQNLDASAVASGAPPVPPTTREPPYAIEGLPWTSEKAPGSESATRRSSVDELAAFEARHPSLAKRDHFDYWDYDNVPGAANLSSQWLYPPFNINDTRATSGASGYNDFGVPKNLSDKTIRTDLVHANGYHEYDVHDMYGYLEARATHAAMLARRPNKKVLQIARSTFMGSSMYTGHWLGDNLSTTKSYIQTVRNMLGHSIYGQPMVGADIGGFGGNATASLLSRWIMLATFSPFMRIHTELASIPQEAYRYENSTKAAQKSTDIRYRFLDALYTGLQDAQDRGSPVLEPLFWRYPADKNTFAVENQYLALSGAVLVSPPTEINVTSVSAYLPDDVFYTMDTWTPVQGNGSWVDMPAVEQWDIPLHIRGGHILPMRNESAMTTTELREKPFVLLIAPDRNGAANGTLYLDDGVSIDQDSTTRATFEYQNGTLTVDGQFGYTGEGARKIEKVIFFGQTKEKKAQMQGQENLQSAYDSQAQIVSVTGFSMLEKFSMSIV